MRKLSQNKWLRFLFILISLELFLQIEFYLSSNNRSINDFKKDKIKIVFLGDCISYNLPRFLEKELLVHYPNLEVYDHLILHGLDELDTYNRISFIKKAQPALIISMLGLYEFSGQNKINQTNEPKQLWHGFFKKIRLYTFFNHYFQFKESPYSNLEKINESISLKDFSNYDNLVGQLKISDTHLSEAHLRGYQLWVRHLKSFSKTTLDFQKKLHEEIAKVTSEIENRSNYLKKVVVQDTEELFRIKQDFEYLFWIKLSLEKYLENDEEFLLDQIINKALSGSLFDTYLAFESISSLTNIKLDKRKYFL